MHLAFTADDREAVATSRADCFGAFALDPHLISLEAVRHHPQPH